MRVFINKISLYHYDSFTLFVAKDDFIPVEIKDNRYGTVSGEDTSLTIHDDQKILSLFSKEFIDKLDYGLTEIKNPNQEVLKAIRRRKIFYEFIKTFEETLKSFPMQTITEIDELRLDYSGGDLSGKIIWSDKDEDYIM